MPAGGRAHAYAAVIDQRSSRATRCGTCAAWPASSASTPSAARAVSVDKRADQYAARRRAGRDRQYADAAGYLEHRARARRRARPAPRTGRRGARPRLWRRRPRRASPRPRLRYRGVDCDAGDGRRGAAAASATRAVSSGGDLNDVRPAGAGCRDDRLPRRSTTRAIGRAFFEHVAAYTTRKLVFDLNPRQYRLDEVVADLRAAGLRQGRRCARSSSRSRRAAGPACRRLGSPSAAGRSRGSRSASASPISWPRTRQRDRERLEADVHTRPSSRRSLVRRVELVGTNVVDVTSTRHGPGGGRSEHRA